MGLIEFSFLVLGLSLGGTAPILSTELGHAILLLFKLALKPCFMCLLSDFRQLGFELTLAGSEDREDLDPLPHRNEHLRNENERDHDEHENFRITQEHVYTPPFCWLLSKLSISFVPV